MGLPELTIFSAAAPLLQGYRSRREQRFYFSKWITFSAAAFLMLSAGLGYSFSVYSTHLKERFGYSQTLVSGLGTFGNLGAYMALPAGVFYDSMIKHRRVGPKLTACIGALLYALGYLGLYSLASGAFGSAPHYAWVATAMVLANNGGCWLEAAAMVTTVRNFETERGVVIGILKAMLGLSASFYITIYSSFLAPHRLLFLLLLGTLAPLMAVGFGLMLNGVPFVQTERHLKSHAFHMVFASIVSLALYLLLTSTAYTQQLSSTIYEGVITTGGMLMLLAPLVSVPFIFGGVRAIPLSAAYIKPVVAPAAAAKPAGSSTSENSFSAGSSPPSHNMQMVLPCSRWDGLTASGSSRGDAAELGLVGDAPEPMQAPPAAKVGRLQEEDVEEEEQQQEEEEEEDASGVTDERQLSMRECLRCADFWLLLATASLVTGGGLAFANNVGSIVASLGGNGAHGGVVGKVSLFSVASCIGRITSGIVPDRQLRIRGTPRTTWLIASAVLMACANLATAWTPAQLLDAVALFTGACFGLVQGLVPTITSELFGLQNLASNYGMVQLGLALASYTLATQLVGQLYDLQGQRQGSTPNDCHGPQCFRLSFLIISGVMLLAMLAAIVLHRRNRLLYHHLRRKAARERSRRGVQALGKQVLMLLQRYYDNSAHLSSLLSKGVHIMSRLHHVDAGRTSSLERDPSSAGTTPPSTSGTNSPPGAAAAPGTAASELASIVHQANARLGLSMNLHDTLVPAIESSLESISRSNSAASSARMRLL